MADIFIVLYVTNVTGVSLAHYGVLVAVQMVTSILVYIPAAKVADRMGRKPFVIATFVCFALFPVAVVARAGVRVAGSGLRHRRPARDRRALAQGDDR